MAKTIDEKNMRPKGKKTEVTKKSDADQDKPNVFSVYLKDHERDALFEIVDELGVNRHSILKYAILYFIQHYRAGDVEIETKTTKKIVS
jgi:hypothetical protein